MKAMLYADWMNFRQSIRSILFVLVAFALSAFAFSGPMFFNFTVVFLSIMVPTTLFAADQAYGWNRLSLSMPILRRDVVGSKFVIGALVNVVLLAVSTVLTVVYVLADATGNPSAELMENLAGILACEAIAFLMMGILMALSFKFGIEKGRYIIMACVWVPVLGVFLLERLPWFETALQAAGNWLNAAGETQISLLLAAALAAGLAVYAVCYFISVRIYQKKEL